MLQAFAARKERSQRDQRINLSTEQMNSFAQSIAAVIAAGCFGLAVTQTAMQQPLQSHSGTQEFVRVVR
jgi:hypothetical protein